MADGGHFYKYPGGEPCYEVLDGKGEKRAPTLRDAKKGLKGQLKPYEIYPSVTTIVKSLGTPPGLMGWMLDTLAECAATNPCHAGETADEYKVRLQADAERWRNEAAELGTAMHDDIEHVLLLRDVAPSHAKTSPDFLVPVAEWLSNNVAGVFGVETPFACADGYGGRIDLIAKMKDGSVAVIDFKTQGTKEKYGHATRAYDEWGEQLAAYAEGCNIVPPGAILMNLVISSTKPGVVEAHVWDDVERYVDMWRCKLDYYKLAHDWYPENAPQDD